MSRPLARRTKATPERAEARVGRNEPCPCSSGKKFKKCCGAPRRLSSAKARECGTCRACCTVLGEPSIDVGAYQTCRFESVHQDAPGCSIHEDYPANLRRAEFFPLPLSSSPSRLFASATSRSLASVATTRAPGCSVTSRTTSAPTAPA